MSEINIGALIEKQVRASGISITELAKELHCRRQNIYDIFKRKSIDIEMLIRISEVLNYDFLGNVYLKSIQTKKEKIKFTVEIEGGHVKLLQTENASKRKK